MTEEKIEKFKILGPIPVLTLTTLQTSALDIQAQADAIALQTQAINDQVGNEKEEIGGETENLQMNTLTQEVQKLEDTAKQLNSQVSSAIIQAGSTPTTSTNQVWRGKIENMREFLENNLPISSGIC